MAEFIFWVNLPFNTIFKLLQYNLMITENASEQ